MLHTELSIAQEELETMSRLNSRLGYEIKRNELALGNMMRNYEGRQKFARRLEQDVVAGGRGGGEGGQRQQQQEAGGRLNRIDEEEDEDDDEEEEEEEEEEEDDDGASSTSGEAAADDSEAEDEELAAGSRAHRRNAGGLLFPVLAPPEQFQNCLSPSATYEGGRVAVASPAYSSSSAATEKSVRFSDRDLILSTPEPQPQRQAWPLFRQDKGIIYAGICYISAKT